MPVFLILLYRFTSTCWDVRLIFFFPVISTGTVLGGRGPYQPVLLIYFLSNINSGPVSLKSSWSTKASTWEISTRNSWTIEDLCNSLGLTFILLPDCVCAFRSSANILCSWNRALLFVHTVNRSRVSGGLKSDISWGPFLKQQLALDLLHYCECVFSSVCFKAGTCK